ncbi:MAG: serine hydrolase [Chitinophagaceae bacterium]|nr:serine hydrolase [Chitinophagaceae bacterium]
MKKTSCLWLLICFVFSAFAQTMPADKRFNGIETELETILKECKAAGFAVAVIEKNNIVYIHGFGYRDIEKKLPVTANTLFPIGSCTKSFTAAMIGILENAKLVNLDQPVHNYFPTLSFYSDKMNSSITLRDMMSHRTGLPRHDASWVLFPTSSKDSLLQRIHYMEPAAELREKWQYNNFMYFAQGMLIEKQTGKSWDENIREKFFTPLGMQRTTTSLSQLQSDENAAAGYQLQNDSVIKRMDYHEVGTMGPAGSINSNVMDMARWVSTWMHGGIMGGTEIIPPSFVRQALSSQMIITPAFPEKDNPGIYFANYGLGWFLGSYQGHYRVDHAGNIDGFSANIAFFPTDSIGIVVLSNQDASLLPSLVRNIIADRVLNLSKNNWVAFLQKNKARAKAIQVQMSMSTKQMHKNGTNPSHVLKDYEGLYTHPAYGTMEVSSKPDSLFLHIHNKILWLKHYHYDVFVPVEADPSGNLDTTGMEAGLKVQFKMDVKGNIFSLAAQLEPALNALEFTRTRVLVKMRDNF